MGKVKSAIITALLVAAIIVLALFATISCNVPGSDGVDRYNSFISSISLGSELTGDASVILYPAGVITEAEYNDKSEEDQADYEYIAESCLYIEKDKLYDDEGNDIRCQFAASVNCDAKILSDRFSQKGYSSYSVAVVDTYGIKITVPTGFSYKAYKKGYDKDARNKALTDISNTIALLTLNGGLSLRSSSTYADNNFLYLEQEDNEFNTFFKNARFISRGGVSVVRIRLTDDGMDKINTILTTSNAESAILYIGETNIGLSFTVGEEVPKNLDFSPSYAKEYAIVISSVVNGNMLTNKYNDNSKATLTFTTPVYGEHAAIFFAAFALVLILVAAILPIIKYKKLGLVNALMVLAYSVAITTAILLTGVQLTVGGLFTALLGLALLCFSNFFTFEAIRRETALGRTIEASIKLGYKRSMFGVLDVHVVLVIAAILMTLIGVGELAACGLIFLIASIASFALYWFTRFMWYTLSSPVRNKFAFCGFVREVEDDE